MPKIHYVKRKWLENRAIRRMTILSSAAAERTATLSSSTNNYAGADGASTVGNVVARRQSSPNIVDEVQFPHTHDDTDAMPTPSTPQEESEDVLFSWSINADKVLMDYCAYFMNGDGSICDEKWAPIANVLQTSAYSCRRRWHKLKAGATKETWVQQQQHLWQHLRLSVHQHDHHTSVKPSIAAPAQVEIFNPEFDAYLQRVLWDDEDFVRAVDETNRDEEKAFHSLESPEPSLNHALESGKKIDDMD